MEIKDQKATLRDGMQIPLLGIGTRMQPQFGETAKTIEDALDAGYRHIDTAYSYLNEKEVGLGIKNWLDKNPSNKREDIYVVTKMPTIGMSPEGVDKFFKKSYENLGLSYIDLYLVHWPIGLKGDHDEDVQPFRKGRDCLDFGTDLIAIWKAMERLVDTGKVRSIGVSNFNVRQMRKIDAIARIAPVANQMELNVYFQRKDFQKYCKEKGILIIAYAPLGSPGRETYKIKIGTIYKLMDDPVVRLVANNHEVTPAQVLTRFLVQSGIAVIPKSTNQNRMKENADIFGFSLTDLEMEALELLDKGEAGRGFHFNNIFSVMSEHPEFPS